MKEKHNRRTSAAELTCSQYVLGIDNINIYTHTKLNVLLLIYVFKHFFWYHQSHIYMFYLYVLLYVILYI